MKRILASLLVLVLLVLGSLPDCARAASTPPEKTASGPLAENPDKYANYTPLLVTQLQRDAELWGPGTVLDVDVGPNLYTYVRQNPWSAFDPTGLADVPLVDKHLTAGTSPGYALSPQGEVYLAGGLKVAGGAVGVLFSTGVIGGTGGLSSPLAAGEVEAAFGGDQEMG